MPYIEARDGTELYLKDWGDGPPVILIHGWPLSSDSWDDQALALVEAGHRVIAYDRRGFGRSEQPAGGYDYDTFADDLADVIEAVDAEDEQIALVGFSMGGGEIARYLSRHGSQGISKVALIGSVAPCLLKSDDNPEGVPEEQFEAMREGIRKDRAAFFESFFKTFFGVGFIAHPVSDSQLNLAWTMAMQAGLLPTLATLDAFAGTDFRPDLAAIDVPTLIIHGTSDKTVPIEPTGRAAAAAIPGARLIEYDGAPHGLFATEKDRLSRDLIEFLGGTGTSFMLRDDERAREEGFADPLTAPTFEDR